MAAVWSILTSIFPEYVVGIFLGLIALVAIILIVRIIATILDAIPFL